MSESQFEGGKSGLLDEDAIRSSIWDLISEKQFSEAFAASKAWSSKGSSNARIFLGWLYEHGLGVSPNLSSAYDLYRSVATLGVPEAQFCLGKLCLRISQPGEAIEWLERASARDFPPAAFRLFVIYSQGKIVATDFRKSDFYLEKAARLGHIYAAKQLAIHMIKGIRTRRKILWGGVKYIYAIVNGARKIIRDPYATQILYMDR